MCMIIFQYKKGLNIETYTFYNINILYIKKVVNIEEAMFHNDNAQCTEK